MGVRKAQSKAQMVMATDLHALSTHRSTNKPSDNAMAFGPPT